MVQHQPLYLVFALTLSLGLFLAVAGPSLRRSRVDMATRLCRLDPDVWRAEVAQTLLSNSFQGGLRPILRDAERLWERVLQSLHLTIQGQRRWARQSAIGRCLPRASRSE